MKNLYQMKQFLPVLLGTIVLLSSCSKETIHGGGSLGTETRQVASFTQVEVSGDSEVSIVFDSTQEVIINGYQNLLPVYETEVRGGTLYLHYRDEDYRVSNGNVKVAIHVPVLAGLQIHGSGKANVLNFSNGDILNTAINGSGNMNIADSRYNKATYVINGSGEIQAATNIAKEANAQISGSGRIDLHASEKLKASISGSGEISYWGSPIAVDTQINGSGRITKN